MKYRFVAIPKILQTHVEAIVVGEYHAETDLTANVYLNGLPGIIFQHTNGHSPIDHITTASSIRADTPTLFVYGQMTELNVVRYKREPFTTTQIFLKPQALQTLLGVNAATLNNQLVELHEFSARDLNMQLLDAPNEETRLTLLTDFLASKLRQATTGDRLIEESLRIIHSNVSFVSVRYLFECMNLSERQFEKRFSQTVGLTPQFYIRVKRYNEVVRFMLTGQFENLTDLAHRLNYYDQSHFARDIKALSGLTPKDLFRFYTQKCFMEAGSSSYPNQQVDVFEERDGFLQF